MHKLVQGWLNRVIFVWPWNGYARPKLKRGKNLYMVNRINCAPLLLSFSEHTAISAEKKKYCWKVISITWESCWTIKQCPLNFMILFGGKMKSPRFSSARFAHSTVPEHFTLVVPSLSKNLRELLKIYHFWGAWKDERASYVRKHN